MLKKIVIGGGGIAALAVAGLWWDSAPTAVAPAQETSTLVIPTLSQVAQSGEVAFNANCAACHGTNGGGTDQGPPLIHRIYEPGHHGDMSFLLAAQNGVRAHHWRFGNMPPVEGITETQIRWIVKYIREIQTANGIG